MPSEFRTAFGLLDLPWPERPGQLARRAKPAQAAFPRRVRETPSAGGGKKKKSRDRGRFSAGAFQMREPGLPPTCGGSVGNYQQ